MDYFDSNIVERLAAEFRTDALAHARQDGIARRAALATNTGRGWLPRAPFARLAQFLDLVSVCRARFGHASSR